jgi:hypothetical protein
MGSALPALFGFRVRSGRCSAMARCRFEVRRLAVIHQRQRGRRQDHGRSRPVAILATAGRGSLMAAGASVQTCHRRRHGRPNAVVRSARGRRIENPFLFSAEAVFPFGEGGLGAAAKIITGKAGVDVFGRLCCLRALPIDGGAHRNTSLLRIGWLVEGRCSAYLSFPSCPALLSRLALPFAAAGLRRFGGSPVSRLATASACRLLSNGPGASSCQPS